MPSLVFAVGHDAFSSSLSSLSYRLRKLEFKVVADSSLFWPADSAASWSNLEIICVLFHIASPSGRWYFKGPLDHGDDTVV